MLLYNMLQENIVVLARQQATIARLEEAIQEAKSLQPEHHKLSISAQKPSSQSNTTLHSDQLRSTANAGQISSSLQQSQMQTTANTAAQHPSATQQDQPKSDTVMTDKDNEPHSNSEEQSLWL